MRTCARLCSAPSTPLSSVRAPCTHKWARDLPRVLFPRDLLRVLFLVVPQLPTFTTQIDKATGSLSAMLNTLTNDKDQEIKALKAEKQVLADTLTRERADHVKRTEKLEEMLSKLMMEKMDLAVEAAGFKAEATQLRQQLDQQGRQIESWVTYAFTSRITHAQYQCCDESGSLID